MVAVNVCCTVDVFGDAVTVTLPLPDPDVGARDNAALAVAADHEDGAHPAGDADTFTTCEPPLVAKFAADGEMANVHGLIVVVGWVVEGAFVGDDPLHAAIVMRIRETANVVVRLIGRDYSDHCCRSGYCWACSLTIGIEREPADQESF
jgi:hypothetical protein